ncbi:MAG TPA: nucleotidyltransferase [Candidatus Ligilactobacillus excrementigallinarum]|uniref:tRNA(Met) cytidine acetate ligase n=1 Tax=Candidatus Ligilactobacillus excrementigallinarum TaxID=2838641 RepID=A0A9D2AB18_9LACO|nr:nucleotidyltransferase [Candidatus Ligilactobacillus excrementigallinarum]
MSQVAGIIAEYNPFHNGHLYQIQQVKQTLPDASLVVAMSGNFLQRGEPAILDKWHRARQCLQAGADLVLELPFAAAVQAADRFAYYGVWTLKQAGVTDLFFGAEHSDYDFMKYAAIVSEISGNFNQYHESYAETYQKIITEKIGHSIDQPNDVLGLAYAKANLKLNANLKLHPIQRKNANYHDMQLANQGTIASASAIRQAVFDQKTEISKYVPQFTLQDLKKEKTVSWNDFWLHFKLELLTHSAQELESIYGMREGIQYRMIAMAQQAETCQSFAQWMKAVKTKRFTYTRLSRLATMVMLHVTQADIEYFYQHPFIRVLGFNNNGKAVLHTAKKKTQYPIITNVTAKDKKEIFNLDYRVGKGYQAINGAEQDLKHAPIIINDVSSKTP